MFMTVHATQNTIQGVSLAYMLHACSCFVLKLDASQIVMTSYEYHICTDSFGGLNHDQKLLWQVAAKWQSPILSI